MEILPEAESADTPEALYDLKTTQATINNALSRLPSHKRAAYELIKEEEKTYKQVSEILNIPVSTLEKQHASSLKLLKKALHLFF